MQLEWKDNSSWSKSDVDRTPKTWSATVGKFTVVVTRRHGLPGWYLDFHHIFNYKILESTEIEAAKREATFLIYRLLDAAMLNIKPDGSKT